MEENPLHFDSKVNYEMYRWNNALITDTQLLEELEENVFPNKHKGRSLEGIINIAIGNKKAGLEMLEKYNKKNAHLLEIVNPSENLRRRKARESAKDMYEIV